MTPYTSKDFENEYHYSMSLFTKIVNDHNVKPIGRKLKISANMLNMAIKLSNVTPHMLYLGDYEQYFSIKDAIKIKKVLPNVTGVKDKIIHDHKYTDEPMPIKLTDFCRGHQLKSPIIRNAIIKNNQPYHRINNHSLYISKSVAKWVLQHHINNKPTNYLSLSELANKLNINRQTIRNIKGILIDADKMKKPHHYIGSSITYLDLQQQTLITKYYLNEYQHGTSRYVPHYKIEINTNIKYNENKHVNCKQLTKSLGLTNKNCPITWARLGQIEYEYDGQTLYFTKSEASKIKADYRNYPIPANKLISKSKMEKLIGHYNKDLDLLCKKLNVPQYHVLGDRRTLLRKSDIKKLQSSY